MPTIAFILLFLKFSKSKKNRKCEFDILSFLLYNNKKEEEEKHESNRRI